MSYRLGIDPSSKPELTAYAAVDDTGKLAPGYAEVHQRGTALICPDWGTPAAVIIECIETNRGIYKRKGFTNGQVRDFGATIREEERLKAIYRDVCPVYCVPRRVILAQAGYSPRRDGPADKWVSRYLEGLGYARELWKEPGHYYRGKTWRGTQLNTPDKRDALMAALFNWRDARNQEYAQTGKD